MEYGHYRSLTALVSSADDGRMDSWLSLGALGVVAVGFASGILSGMFGVGGAVLTTPGIRVLGASPIAAVGSTVPAILPGAVSGTIRYARAGLVNWRIGVVCGCSGTVLAIAGAHVAHRVNAHGLMVLTAVLLGWSGVNVARSGRHTAVPALAVPAGAHDVGGERVGAAGHALDPVAGVDAGERVEPMETVEPVEPVQTAAGTIAAARTSGGDARTLPTRTHVATGTLVVVGAVSGFLAGLLGVGGGVVMMPAFTNVLRIPVKEAVASSLVAVFVFSVPALGTHAVLGHIDWWFATLLIVGVVPGAQVGSHLTLAASDRTVRTLFGVFLVVLATAYGAGELAALRT